MKAISPMIATILLIAFTVAVGGIISIWMTSFARTSSAGTEVRSEALTRCTTSGFEVISCTSGKIRIIHYGSGLIIFPLSVVTSDGTVSAASASPSQLASGTPGEITFTRGTNTSVTVRANCQYGNTTNVTIEASCSSGDKCWIVA
jgi:flagellin-like protein